MCVGAYELELALERIFRSPVSKLTRQPSPYSSSFPIEELEVTFAGGGSVTTVFKNVGTNAVLDNAFAAKPSFLYHPQREIQVYQSILSSLHLGTATLHGNVVEPAIERYWLFLEKVPGLELYQIGDFSVWLEVARWLAGFHAAAISEAGPVRAAAPLLLEHDAAYHRIWIRRAHALLGAQLDRLNARYEQIIEILLALPRTLIHGEFYPSNILVDQSQSRLRVCPVDWEMAAIGPGLLDVAALAAGKWSREQRLCFAEAYDSALPDSLRPKDLITAFDCCQLQLALQWLGWSDGWLPPQEHAHDWLAEVFHLFAGDSLRRLLA
jgi:hypothetical protein